MPQVCTTVTTTAQETVAAQTVYTAPSSGASFLVPAGDGVTQFLRSNTAVNGSTTYVLNAVTYTSIQLRDQYGVSLGGLAPITGFPDGNAYASAFIEGLVGDLVFLHITASGLIPVYAWVSEVRADVTITTSTEREVCVEQTGEGGGGGGGTSLPPTVAVLAESVEPGFFCRWVRPVVAPGQPAPDLAYNELGHKVTASWDWMGWTDRRMLVVERRVQWRTSGRGTPPWQRLDVTYGLARYPGTTDSGNTLWFSWDVTGAGWGAGQWRFAA